MIHGKNDPSISFDATSPTCATHMHQSHASVIVLAGRACLQRSRSRSAATATDIYTAATTAVPYVYDCHPCQRLRPGGI